MSNPRVVLPLAILALGVLGVVLMVALRARVPLAPPEPVAPLVRVQPVTKQPFRFVVEGHGTVVPRTESDLVTQVEGEAVYIAPAFVPGGFFAEGETLVRIDPADYEAALETARAGLARARSEFSRAKKERERQQRLANQSIASQARIDVGQFANRGTSLGRIYAVDYAEVRLPVPDRELSFLDLPLGYQNGGRETGPGPRVDLHAEFAGRPHTWTGHVVRTEGEIDPRSRTVNVVARVEDPYGRTHEQDGVPLAVGLFVEAEIRGREVGDAVVLPRVALRGEGRVLVLDDESRLRFRDVEVLRVERERVVIGAGLEVGERVCVSPLPAAVDGMSVRVVDEPPGVARAGS